MNSGIYQIVNLINGKFYIGSAVDLNRRGKRHFRDLRLNKHDNKYLQNSYNKYGEESFRFLVLEHVIYKEMLIEREQYYLDIFYDNCNDCYNISPTAGSNLGRIMSEEQKLKISKTLMGHEHTEEAKLKMAIGQGSKPFLVYTKEGFFIGIWINQRECSRELNLEFRNINACLKGKRNSAGGYTFKYAS